MVTLTLALEACNNAEAKSPAKIEQPLPVHEEVLAPYLPENLEPNTMDRPKQDCSGLLEEFAFSSDARALKLHGRFAVGSMVEGVFIPLLYFHRLSQAKACSTDEEGEYVVRKWRNGHWAKVDGRD